MPLAQCPGYNKQIVKVNSYHYTAITWQSDLATLEGIGKNKNSEQKNFTKVINIYWVSNVGQIHF